MALTLITGPQDRVHELAIALKSVGFDVLEGPEHPDLIAPGSVDCHIHLADAGPGRGGDGPWEIPGVPCRIVLVPESAAGSVSPWDVELLRAVVDAALDQPGRKLRIEVATGSRPPGGPAPSAGGRPRNWSRYAELEPDLAFADWRNEVMAMMSGG